MVAIIMAITTNLCVRHTRRVHELWGGDVEFAETPQSVGMEAILVLSCTPSVYMVHPHGCSRRRLLAGTAKMILL